jgi:hypothetical protein
MRPGVRLVNEHFESPPTRSNLYADTQLLDLRL